MSSFSVVAAEWQLIYNLYYRKPELHRTAWRHVDLSLHKVARAPFGGPIAAIRDDSKIVQLHFESALRKLHIFSAAGVLLADAVWKNPGGRLVAMAWTDDLKNWVGEFWRWRRLDSITKKD